MSEMSNYEIILNILTEAQNKVTEARKYIELLEKSTIKTSGELPSVQGFQEALKIVLENAAQGATSSNKAIENTKSDINALQKVFDLGNKKGES